MNTVDRLAEVDESNGTTDVSPITIAMRSGARPSSCAAICIITVRAPWPMSDVPHRTDALPSKCSRTIATERDAVEELFKPREMPRPRLGASGAFQSIAAAALASAMFHSPSAGVSLGLKASPLAAKVAASNIDGVDAQRGGRLIQLRFDGP